MKVYVVVRAFESHDMFLAPGAGQYETPRVHGVYSTRAKAKAQLRPEADDYIVVRRLDDAD